MIESIERCRRPSVYDEWPNCDFCCEDFAVGFNFYLDDDQSRIVMRVCDKCLSKAKKSETGWLKQ